MITFKEYLLNENILSGVRASILGLTTSQELPSRPPYGFWVDRSGNYMVTEGFSSGGHAQAAKEIIMLAYDYKDETGQLTRADERALNVALKKGFTSLYEILEEVNFMHVVKSGSGGTYFYRVHNVTPSQQKFLNNLTQTYGVTVEREKMHDSI